MWFPILITVICLGWSLDTYTSCRGGSTGASIWTGLVWMISLGAVSLSWLTWVFA